MRRRSVALLVRAGLLVLAGLLCLPSLACHREVSRPPSAPPVDERATLLQKIANLDELAPCLTEAGPQPLRLIDAEVAGDAARATFACTNGAAKGKVTFFRVAGNWLISTKEISSGR